MVFNERITTITNEKLIPAVSDTILNSNVLLQRLFARANKSWTGTKMKKPIKVSKSTTGGSFDGVDTFDMSTSNTRNKIEFEPKGFYQSVVIPGIEEAVNKTDQQVISLLAVELENAQIDALDSLGTILYGLGNGKDFQGLGAIVDDGTDVASYGGLARATYTGLKATRTASGGTLTLDLMAALMSATSAAGSSNQRPTIGITNETVWNLYESLLTPQVSANYASYGYPMVTAKTAPGRPEQGLNGQQGFVAITYRGMPIVADEKCDAQTLFYLNENDLSFYSLKSGKLQSVPTAGSVIDGVYTESGKTSPFQWTGWKTPVNQFAEAGQLIALGNIIGWNPRRNGKLTGITTA